MIKLRMLLPAVACLAFTAAAPAVTILGNYPSNDGTQSALINDQRRKAMMFTMPSGVDYYITSITLRLALYDAADTAFLEIRDHTGSNTVPGSTIVGSFIAPLGQGSASADYVFSPNGTITLMAGTSYWIYLHGGPSPSSFDWKASSPGVTPTGIATFGPGNLFTTNGGGSWTNSSILNSFIIEGVVVPGPAGLAVLAFGLIGSRRRRS